MTAPTSTLSSRESLVWRANVDLLRSDIEALGPGRLVAYMEEVDRRMPASYRNEPIQPQDLFDEVTFVDSGPRFSARVPFLEVAPPK